MTEESLATGILAGVVLILFGLLPGLLDQLASGVATGIRNFRNSAAPGLPVWLPKPLSAAPARRPLWLAWLGVALLGFTVAAYNLA